VDLRDTPEEAQFRAEVRGWIQDNLPDELRGHRGGAARFEGEALRAWSRALSEAGYPGLTWPAKYGGRGAPYSHQAIFYEEMARAEAPPHVGVIGLGMAGPTIIAHGTEAPSRRPSRWRPTGRASSSTVRKCGRPTRTSPISASSSAEETRRRPGTRTSRT
jgi:alkylation response protein AidB-like acyl-CoA dehydrogenase